MDGRAVLFVLGNLLAIFGLALLAPLVVSLVMVSDAREPYVFASLSIFSVGVGLLARWCFASAAQRVRVREGFAIVTFSWLLLSAVGMTPYLLLDCTESVTDAFFETMSGFTTTGASIFVDVEVLPAGVQFWRCMTQWLGGMGIVVLSVALLPMLGVGGYRLLKAESPGGIAYEREHARITDVAQELWRLYLAFSAVAVVLLWASGMSWYDAFCHAFTTLSTGGFSSKTASVAAYPSALTQWIIIVFMVLAAINFGLYTHLVRGRFTLVAANPEWRFYMVVLILVVGAGVALVPRTSAWEPHVRTVAFQIVSVSTTTGFATSDFNLWPSSMRLLLVLLMFLGGSMGSTSGGMKAARWLIYGKAIARELHRLIFPHAVRPLRVGARVLEANVVSNILAFGLLFTASVAMGTMVMADCGYDLVTSATAAVAALSNIGPGLGAVGPAANWAHLPNVAKWVMSFLMLLGRLELFSVMVLFTPWVWRR